MLKIYGQAHLLVSLDYLQAHESNGFLKEEWLHGQTAFLHLWKTVASEGGV